MLTHSRLIKITNSKKRIHTNLKTIITRRHRRLLNRFWCRLNRESLIFQTTQKSASEALTGPNYEWFEAHIDNKNTETASNMWFVFVFFLWFFCVLAIYVHNSASWTPQTLILASFERWDSHESNDQKSGLEASMAPSYRWFQADPFEQKKQNF